MPVTFIHALYTEFLPKWERMRDVLGGEDAVKKKGDAYVPRLTEQSNEDYAAYLQRGSFFPATGRTREGLLGLIFRKDPDVKVPKSMEDLLEDITLRGQSLFAFAKHVVTEVFSTARYGIYVDWNDAEKRPVMVGYSAEQIINWRTEKIGDKYVLTLVVIKECESIPSSDGYGMTEQTIYRALRLEPIDETNAQSKREFRVYVYRPTVSEPQGTQSTPAMVRAAAGTGTDPSGSGQTMAEEKVVPKIRGTPLDFIPFTFVGLTNNLDAPQRPLLEDIALVNLSHFRSSVDLEHGRHFTALPTAWVAGFSSDSKLRIGAGTAWVTDNPNAKAAFLEFTGQGLAALDKAIEDKERQMEALGARILEQQKKAAETAETLKVRQSGEASALGSTATTISEAITLALVWMNYWMTSKVEVDRTVLNCALNTDYFDASVDGSLLTSLVSAWQMNAISHKTLLWNLKEGEILPPEIDEEEEIDRINEEAPKLGSGEALPLDPKGEVPATQRDAQDAAAREKAAKDADEKARSEAELKLQQQQIAAKGKK